MVWGILTEPGETTTQVLLVTYTLHTCCVMSLILCVDFMVQNRELQAQLGLSPILILLQFFNIHVKHWTIITGQCQME